MYSLHSLSLSAIKLIYLAFLDKEYTIINWPFCFSLFIQIVGAEMEPQYFLHKLLRMNMREYHRKNHWSNPNPKQVLPHISPPGTLSDLCWQWTSTPGIFWRNSWRTMWPSHWISPGSVRWGCSGALSVILLIFPGPDITGWTRQSSWRWSTPHWTTDLNISVTPTGSSWLLSRTGKH